MNRSYLSAGGLAVLAAVVRTVDGYSGPLRVARESAIDPAVVGFFHLTWNMVTAVFVVSAVALVLLARPGKTAGSRGLGTFMGVIFIVWSVLIAIVGFWFVRRVPATIPMLVTFAIGALCLFGARPARSRKLHGR